MKKKPRFVYIPKGKGKNKKVAHGWHNLDPHLEIFFACNGVGGLGC